MNNLGSKIRLGLVVCAILSIAMFIVVALLRIRYPYELEWMEGGMVDHVRQILSGAPLYAAPTIRFVAYVYPPFYYYISALFSLVFGIGFFPLRFVSLVSSLGCFYFIFLIVRRETSSVSYGIISAGLYAATYRLSGAWFDLARVDSLAMLLILSSLCFLRTREQARTIVLAGVLLSMSFLTKQSSIVILPFAAYYCIVTFHGWNRWSYLLTFLFVSGVGTALMSWNSHGWYYYYCFELPAQHSLMPEMLWNYLYSNVGISVTIGCALSIWMVSYAVAGVRRNEIVFYCCFLGGLFVTSILACIHRGAYYNALMPVYAAVAIGIGIGLDLFIKRYSVEGLNHSDQEVIGQHGATLKMYGIFALCLIQFCILWYNPMAQIPTDEDKKAGDFLIGLMRKTSGEVYLPYHGYLPILAGKSTYAHAMAIGDIVGSQSDSLRDNILRQVRDAIRSRTFQAIILDEPTFTNDILGNYSPGSTIFHDQNVFFPVTGSRMRPEKIFLLNQRGVGIFRK